MQLGVLLSLPRLLISEPSVAPRGSGAILHCPAAAQATLGEVSRHLILLLILQWTYCRSLCGALTLLI